MADLTFIVPEMLAPLLEPKPYKALSGGRSSGKSHFVAECIVVKMVQNPHLQVACIREVQKSIKFSAKKLIEDKIQSMGVSHLFKSTLSETRRVGGRGLIIYQGLQDHNADSIKGVEGFDLFWAEEAANISARSLELLLPTIRKDGAELWMVWNPQQESDPVDVFSRDNPDCIRIHINYPQNLWCPQRSIDLANWQKGKDYDAYRHIWLGDYATKSADQVLAGCWRVANIEIDPYWSGPYFGMDFGFSTDPNAVIKCYVGGRTLYITDELYGHGIEINDTPKFMSQLDGIEKHVIRADSARPEVISYLKHHGFPRITAVSKWPGSVEDGISTLRGFDEIVINEGCQHMIDEAKLWRYKTDKISGDVLPKLLDKDNHCADALRYAIAPLIKRDKIAVAW